MNRISLLMMNVMLGLASLSSSELLAAQYAYNEILPPYALFDFDEFKRSAIPTETQITVYYKPTKTKHYNIEWLIQELSPHIAADLRIYKIMYTLSIHKQYIRDSGMIICDESILPNQSPQRTILFKEIYMSDGCVLFENLIIGGSIRILESGKVFLRNCTLTFTGNEPALSCEEDSFVVFYNCTLRRTSPGALVALTSSSVGIFEHCVFEMNDPEYGVVASGSTAHFIECTILGTTQTPKDVLTVVKVENLGSVEMERCHFSRNPGLLVHVLRSSAASMAQCEGFCLKVEDSCEAKITDSSVLHIYDSDAHVRYG
ncbi:MAG: right-handed parallel beta-helix repeat-containing protein [Holosporales bacterium]|jgi:hypothetical protein|nr:right-handed parallel beta-helix repeat-containing protein [Holosporales bacterium]